MILTKDTGLPEHYSNSNVYMIITKGTMTISLNDGIPKEYGGGNILNIPFNTKMNVKNLHDEILEFFVVKAPNPKDMVKDRDEIQTNNR
jgi:quercetin dioxygenase-like cupin family protein